MVNANHAADFNSVSEDLQTNQLVVIPSLWFFWKNIQWLVNQQNGPDQALGLSAVIDALKKNNWGIVKPFEICNGDGFAKPWRLFGNLKF